MIDYVKAFERSSNLFPGLEAEVESVYHEADAGKILFHTYVVGESALQRPQGPKLLRWFA